MSETQKFLAFVAGMVVVLGALAVAVPRLLGLAAGPEVEIVSYLKGLEQRGVELSVDAGTLSGHRLSYQRLSVQVDGSGDTARVTATLDLVGSIDRGPGTPRTEVSSLGLEEIPFRRTGDGWTPRDGPAPRLALVLDALEARRAGLERAGAVHRSLSWFIRTERDRVEVAEEYRRVKPTATGPGDVRATARLTFALAPGGELALEP